MSDEATSSAFETFVEELRRVLQNLYSPLALRDTPLFGMLGLEDGRTQISTLRERLVEAIQALKPGDDVPTHSPSWRTYYILRYRYVEQSAQRTVANNMGLSERQLRRQERDAEEALADYLWRRYDLQAKAETMLSASTQGEAVPAAPNGTQRRRQQELEWARSSYPSEVTDVAATIEAAVRTVAPLIQAIGVELICELEEKLPPVTGQQMLLRQAFLSLLTAAVHQAHGGKVRVAAERHPKGIAVFLDTEKAEGTAAEADSSEHLAMARQCIDLFGGELIMGDAEDEALRTATGLLLPVTEPVTVLMIDDNLDTLHLFQRYLASTQYQFVGISNPEEVLATVECTLPEAIVLDVMLPGVDGWELLGRLREHPWMRDVPVIVCTVMPQEELALALGAAAYLRKPVTREALLSTLDQQIRSRRTESG